MRLTRSRLWKVLTVGLIVMSSLLITAVSERTSSSISQAFFIDVGQGDSILLRDGNGFDVLIDGGQTWAGPTVLAYLREQGVPDIDVMVASHADADHIGGLIDVLNAADIPVLQVLYNGYPGTTQTWATFATAVANEGMTPAPAQFPAMYVWGGMSAYVLNPSPGLISPDQNNASVVLLVNHGNVDYLLTGDIDSTVEATVMARGTPIAAEILKVAHHGSRYSSSEVFLGTVQAGDAVISVGDNSYGHPTAETLARLAAAGATIWRTDLAGTVTVISDGTGVTVSGDVVMVFLPLSLKQPTPTPIPTETTTPIPPTATSTSTATPAPGGNVQITFINYDGSVPYTESDEWVSVKNFSAGLTDMTGWSINAGDPGQNYFFPSGFVMQSGQECRVYTNEIHPETCGLSFGRSSAIWNNSGDCGHLYSREGQEVSTYCY